MKNFRLSNKKAETLLELIIALFLLSLVLFGASSVLKNFTSFTKRYEENLEDEDDINLFFSFIENDFSLYNTVSVNKNSIYFEKRSRSKFKTCEYIIDNDKIKREAGGELTGKTYFLKGVKDLSFTYNPDDNIVILNLKFKDKEYKKILSTKYVEVIEWKKLVQA